MKSMQGAQRPIENPGLTGRTGRSAAGSSPIERMRARFEQPERELRVALTGAQTETRTCLLSSAATSYDSTLRFGDVCAGWTPHAWAVELRRKARRCQSYRPDVATYFTAWAKQIESRLPLTWSGGCPGSRLVDGTGFGGAL